MVEILFEDAAVIAVNKPGGLLTQAPLGIDSLEFRLKRLLRDRDPTASNVYLGVPHRLDRPASGVIVFAKTLKAAQKLSIQFERRFIAKTYWAIVEGVITADEGTWTDHLKKIEGEPRSMVVDPSDPEGRKAVMHYRVLSSSPWYVQRGDRSTQGSDVAKIQPPNVLTRSVMTTALEITLETGRTHQIRIQCASRGHPILGDDLYGSRTSFGPWSDDERERLIALHARSLTFRHPTTREDMTLIAPLPDYWRSYGDLADAPLAHERPEVP